MGHLSEDTAVGGGNALNSGIGAVYIPLLIHGNIAFRIGVLGCHLAVFKESADPVFACHEAAFAMGSRGYIGLAQLRASQPG